MRRESKGPGAESRAKNETVDCTQGYTDQTARRQALCRHLAECGPRPVYELLLDVSAGVDIDVALENYGRIPAQIYHRVGASEFGGDR
jgi:hypothetical protein